VINGCNIFWVKNWQKRAALWEGALSCNKKKSRQQNAARRNTALGMFKDSAIILYAIQRSFLTKSATVAMFTSVRVDFGLPPLSPSSISSLVSKSRIPPKNVQFFTQLNCQV
jgi:hypothetical protein